MLNLNLHKYKKEHIPVITKNVRLGNVTANNNELSIKNKATLCDDNATIGGNKIAAVSA